MPKTLVIRVCYFLTSSYICACRLTCGLTLATWGRRSLSSIGIAQTVVHLIRGVPTLSCSRLLGTSERKLCDHFLFCLPNPCFSSRPWVNFREALPEHKSSLGRRVMSGDAIAQGRRQSHGSAILDLGMFSCSFGFHGSLTKVREGALGWN
jgi:hypothetical protein